MTSIAKYKGILIEFANGEKLVVPPLSLGAVEVLQERLTAYKGGLDQDSIALVVDSTLLALQRNYPDITADYIKNELVDLSNMQEVMTAVMDISGLKRKEQEKGEALAGN